MRNRKSMDIKSSISYIEKIAMYKVDLGFYTKYFEYLIYSYENISSYTFWDINPKINIDKNVKTNNKVIWITWFLDYFLLCLFDLNDFSSKYFLCKEVYIFSHNLKNKDYLFMIYKDREDREILFHNCDLVDFEIIYKNESFEIINKVIDVNIIKKEIILKNTPNPLPPQLKWTEGELQNKFSDISTIDLYYFDDLFSGENQDILENLLYLNDLDINNNSKIVFEKTKNSIFPKYKISIYMQKVDFQSFLPYLKVFLSTYPKQFLSYTVDNIELNNYLQDLIENINELNLQEMKTDFEIPRNALNYDANFLDFQLSIMKLRYIIYSLQTNLDIIESVGNADLHSDNSGLHSHNSIQKTANIRLNMQKENLENLIKVYSEKLSEFLDKIKL